MRPNRPPRSLSRARTALAAYLTARLPEIEEAVYARVQGIADPGEANDPAYAEGLRLALKAALEYGLQAIEGGEDATPPVPISLLAQARAAPRAGVPLDTVLRRYFAGYALLGDFLLGAVSSVGLDADEVKTVVRGNAAILDRLLAAVSDEYRREASEIERAGAEPRRLQYVKRILSGGMVDASDLGYNLDDQHLGVVASGAESPKTLRALAAKAQVRILLVKADRDLFWAWFGGRSLPDPTQIARSLKAPVRKPGTSIALGEPGNGIKGWRLTHRQATAAFNVIRRSGDALARYGDVALLATSMQDEVLADSLRELFLRPLESGRDDGEAARETLRAYLVANRNVSSAAAALGVNRRTVIRRLRAAEEAIGRPLDAVATSIKVALDLERLERSHVAQIVAPD